MLALPAWHILFSSLLSFFVLPALGSPAAQLKQATRSEVVGMTLRAPSGPPQVSPMRRSCTMPSGNPPNSICYDFEYGLYYSGSGYTESPLNPGNSHPAIFPPAKWVFAHTDVVTAARLCAEFADNQQYTSEAEDAYWSIDLSFHTSTCSWSCTAYWGANGNPDHFNVPNSDVALGFGYAVGA